MFVLRLSFSGSIKTLLRCLAIVLFGMLAVFFQPAQAQSQKSKDAQKKQDEAITLKTHLVTLDVMVKDSKRYSKTNDWGFFTFGHHAEPYESAAKESSQCAYCHIADVAKTDMVWVQYYPLLKSKID